MTHERFYNPRSLLPIGGIVFRFKDDEGLRQVEITGDGSEASTAKLRIIARKISWSQRALIWANGTVVKAIRIEKVEEEAEE
jgi:hypothetical protein